MDKIFMIVNPSAGDEKGLEHVQSLEAIYKDKGITTKTYKTTGKDNFEEILRKTMNEGYKKIVVLGGDGTISEVVNGIARFEKRPKILLIPSGTTNNFGRTIGSERTPTEFLQVIKNDDLVEAKVDIGYINDQYFISSVAVGNLPTVGWETDTELKAKIGSFAYFLEGIKALTKEDRETFNLRMTTSKGEMIKKDLVLFIIGLSNSIVGIETFFADARIDDGQLHYFGLEKAGLLKEASVLMQQVLKTTEEADELAFIGTLEQAEVHSESKQNFLVDGEKGPTFPIKVGVLPEHLTFIVPQ